MGKTKGTQIIKGALAPFFNDKVIKQCQNQPYGLMCDGSNDCAENKTFAILVCVFDEDLGEVKSRFVDMPVSNIGTAEKLFECIQNSLSLILHFKARVFYCIYYIKKACIRKMLGYFVPLTSIASQSYLTKICFRQKDKQLKDDDINIGNEARAYLLQYEDEIANGTVTRFLKLSESFILK